MNPIIDADFPGGNILFQGIDGNEVKLHPDFGDSSGWFYWCFRARGFAGKKVRFQFTYSVNVLCPFGPAVSKDAGLTWQWLGADSANFAENYFTYTFQANENDIRFCFSIPYLQRNWEQFLERHKTNKRLQPDILCISERGRSVEMLKISSVEKPKAKVLLTCRHHACEATATYVLEGILDAVLAPADPLTEFLARKVEVMAVPFVDKDGVEDGDQGKGRHPRDHNRDYVGESIYESTRAIRRLVPLWGEKQLKISCDLHCPHVNDEPDGKVFFVGQENQAVWHEQQKFSHLLEALPEKAISYSIANDIPYGIGWNSNRNYSQGKSCAKWCAEIPGIKLATSVEIPYSKAAGRALTPDTTKAFGRNLAQVMAQYIQTC